MISSDISSLSSEDGDTKKRVILDLRYSYWTAKSSLYDVGSRRMRFWSVGKLEVILPVNLKLDFLSCIPKSSFISSRNDVTNIRIRITWYINLHFLFFYTLLTLLKNPRYQYKTWCIHVHQQLPGMPVCCLHLRIVSCVLVDSISDLNSLSERISTYNVIQF